MSLDPGSAAAVLAIETGDGEQIPVPRTSVCGWKTIDNILEDIAPGTPIPLPTMTGFEFSCVLAAAQHVSTWNPRALLPDDYFRMLELATYLDIPTILDVLVPFLGPRLLLLLPPADYLRHYRLFRDLLETRAIYLVDEPATVRALMKVMQQLSQEEQVGFKTAHFDDIDFHLDAYGAQWAIHYAAATENLRLLQMLIPRYREATPLCATSVLLEAVLEQKRAAFQMIVVSFRFQFEQGARAELLRVASDQGHVDMVRMVLQTYSPRIRLHPYPSDKALDAALCAACSRGHMAVVTLLMRYPRMKQIYAMEGAFADACAYGHLDVVQLLLREDPRIDPGSIDNQSILLASWHGHANVVKYLLADPRVNAADQEHQAVVQALIHGHMNVVKLLFADERTGVVAQIRALEVVFSDGLTQVLPQLLAMVPSPLPIGFPPFKKLVPDMVRALLADGRADPTRGNNKLLRDAIQFGAADMIALLLADSRVQDSLKLGRPQKSPKWFRRTLLWE
jgi:ankyrin repeat protein